MKHFPSPGIWLSVFALLFAAGPLLARKNQSAKIKAAAIQVEMIQSDEIKLPAEFQVALYENLIHQLEKNSRNRDFCMCIATATATQGVSRTSLFFIARFGASRLAVRRPDR